MLKTIIIGLILFIGFDSICGELKNIGEELKYIKYRIEKEGD
jgi:hypothetical protein